MADFRSVYIQHDDTGDHCLHALYTTPASQVLLSIPRSHMLTIDVAKQSAIGRQITQYWPGASTHTYMAAYLLTEMAKGKGSAWWAYLQSLPTSTKHIASAWSDEELQWLKGTSALETAREQQLWMRRAIDVLRRLPSFPFTYQSFAHARRLVASRCFGYDTDHGHHSTALVPLLDIVNHAADDTTQWTYNTELRAFTLYTTTTVAAHQPLLTSYGSARTNSDLLTSYGFVLEDNVWEAVEVKYRGVGPGGAVLAMGSILRAEWVRTGPQLLMSSVRRLAVQEVTAEQTAGLSRVHTRRQRRQRQRGTRVLVERRVLQRIAEAVRNADTRYGGDRAMEAARLSGWKGEKGKKWQALVVRVGERRVLQWWLDVCGLGERWLADGADVAELWQTERAEVQHLKVEALVTGVWEKALEEERTEEKKTEDTSSVPAKRQRVESEPA